MNIPAPVDTPAPPSTAAKRFFALDVLRGIAACLVLFRHMPDRPVTEAEPWIWSFLKSVGWVGVDLFFVLSGFLISTLLFQEYSRKGSLDVPRFWIRRGLKIWPSYFVAYGGMTALLIGAGLSAGDVGQAMFLVKNAIPNIFFVQNYVECLRWPHSWSVAVEEHFYLVLPLLLLVLIARNAGRAGDPFRALLFIAPAVSIAILCSRCALAADGASWDALYYPTHMRADSLFFGVLLGYSGWYHRSLFDRLARPWPILLLALPLTLALAYRYPLNGTFMSTVGFTLLYLGFGVVVLLAGVYPEFGREGPRPLMGITHPLARVGVYSYTIYLAHSVVYILPGSAVLRELVKAGPLPAIWADRLLFWALSIGGGILLAHLVERPILRYRDRWFPSSSGRIKPQKASG